MTLMRFKAGGYVLAVRANRVRQIISQIDLAMASRHGGTKQTDGNARGRISIINLSSMLNQSGQYIESNRIVLFKTGEGVIGAMVDETLNIGEGVFHKNNTVLACRSGIDPRLFEGFEVYEGGIVSVLDPDYLRCLL